MSGTRNFNLKLTALLCLMPIAAPADDVRLTNDAKLSGNVRSIHENGAVELISPLSPSPILIKGKAVERVIFSTPETPVPVSGTRIELSNGDVLPASIHAFDGKTLSVHSPDAGNLEIPAEAVKAIELGILPQREIYSGPRSLDEWTPDRQGSRNWSYNDGTLTVDGHGQLSMDTKMPRHFIIEFSLFWRGQPNFELSFADPLGNIGERRDRYYLQFNNSGLRINREASEAKRYTTIVQLNRTPDQYTGNRINVEIRVDRSQSLLHLYINGEPEGRFMDLSANPPTAGGIALTSHAPNGTNQQFSDLRILEWDLTGDRHRTEERGSADTDALIVRRGDRYGGKLLSIARSGNQSIYSFKSDFQEAPLEIPESEISTLFLSGKEKETPEQSDRNPFILRLHGGGTLSVSSCSFSDDGAAAKHPLLGKLALKRPGIAQLEHSTTPPKAIPAP